MSFTLLHQLAAIFKPPLPPPPPPPPEPEIVRPALGDIVLVRVPLGLKVLPAIVTGPGTKPLALNVEVFGRIKSANTLLTDVPHITLATPTSAAWWSRP